MWGSGSVPRSARGRRGAELVARADAAAVFGEDGRARELVARLRAERVPVVVADRPVRVARAAVARGLPD